MRRLSRAVLLARRCSPRPAWAANKEIERLQIQIASLQGQIADLQRRGRGQPEGAEAPERAAGRAERLAQEGVQDQKVQDEALADQRSRTCSERLAEVARARSGSQAQRRPPAGLRRAGRGSGRRPPRAAPGAPGAARPAPPAARRPGRPPPRASSTARPTPTTPAATTTSPSRASPEYLRAYPEHRLLRQRPVLDRRVPLRQAEVPEAIEAWNTLFRDYPVERQAARRPGQEGHGPREAGPAQPGPRRVPLRRRPVPQLRRRRASPASGSTRSRRATPRKALQWPASTR